MAFIALNRKKLKQNYKYLDGLFKEHNITWAVVTKMLCGTKIYLEEVIKLGTKEICDARISNLKVVKSIDESIQTVYIKPPAKRSIANIIRYADASFNTEYDTIKMLSDEAGKQGKKHKIIIMIELGDLREGVMGDELMEFYASVFKLPNIEVTGIGTNLNCLYGVLPSEDKLIQLSLYKQLIELRFNRKIPWVTGGTSIIIPMLLRQQVPTAINHFRVGETLFFGNNLNENEPFPEMESDVLTLFAEIIEITEKPKVPTGILGENPSGETYEIKEEDFGKLAFRAIIDVGLLDISPEYLIPVEKGLQVVGASSDMLVVEIGTDDREYKVGDLLKFHMKYMGALRLLNSDYIEKTFED